jgi:hypothetical protein
MLDGTPGGTVDTMRHNGFLAGLGIEDGDPVRDPRPRAWLADPALRGWAGVEAPR